MKIETNIRLACISFFLIFGLLFFMFNYEIITNDFTFGTITKSIIPSFNPTVSNQLSYTYIYEVDGKEYEMMQIFSRTYSGDILGSDSLSERKKSYSNIASKVGIGDKILIKYDKRTPQRGSSVLEYKVQILILIISSILMIIFAYGIIFPNKLKEKVLMKILNNPFRE